MKGKWWLHFLPNLLLDSNLSWTATSHAIKHRETRLWRIKLRKSRVIELMEDQLSLHPLWYEQIMKQQTSFKRNTAPRSDVRLKRTRLREIQQGKYNFGQVKIKSSLTSAGLVHQIFKDNWPSTIITISWSQFSWTEAHEKCLWNSHTQYAHQKVRRHEDYAKAHFTKWAKKLNKDISGRLKLL